jgi:pSer/pThr/pTyr-binding forkhead associated (FHA) protein
LIICPTCAKENEDFFKFCLGCGTDLTGVESSQASAKEESSPAEEAPESPPQRQKRVLPKTAKKPGYREERSDAQSESLTREEMDRWLEAQSRASLSGEKTPSTTKGLNPSASDGEGGDNESKIVGPVTVKRSLPEPGSGVAAHPCRVCGNPTFPTFAFCANCGAPKEENEEKTKQFIAVAPAPERSNATRGRLVLIRDDGTNGPEFPLDENSTMLGRENAHVNFPDDDFLASQHALLNWEDDVLMVHPLDTTNGVFLRLEGELELKSGDWFRVGQELLCYDDVNKVVGGKPKVTPDGTQQLGSPLHGEAWGRLYQRVGTDAPGASYLLSGKGITMGREKGEITFPDDGYVSGKHAVILRDQGRIILKDLGSSNGTYIRLRAPAPVKEGSHILVGQQLFRVQTDE